MHRIRVVDRASSCVRNVETFRAIADRSIGIQCPRGGMPVETTVARLSNIDASPCEIKSKNCQTRHIAQGSFPTFRFEALSGGKPPPGSNTMSFNRASDNPRSMGRMSCFHGLEFLRTRRGRCDNSAFDMRGDPAKGPKTLPCFARV